MEKPRICIDLDNVIAQTDEVMRRVIFEFTGGNVELCYQDIVHFNYWECMDKNGNSITKKEWGDVHEMFSQPENIFSIKPYPNVQKYLEELSKKFDLHIATSRLSTARKATIEWLEKNNLTPHFLHFVKHGEKHKVLGKFTVSIEDHLEQAEDFAKLGTLSYLLAHPWNETSSGCKSIRLSDWSLLAHEILQLEEK